MSPQAQNAPNGAVIDYYLKAAPRGPVTLEIVDASGTVRQTFTSAPVKAASDDVPGGRGVGGIPNTTVLWRPTPEPFSAMAGMHRVVWTAVAGGRGGHGGGGGGGGTPLTGTFTARLTKNGQALTQSFNVVPDPRTRIR